MEWRRMGGYMLSEPDGFAINKATNAGRVYYMAVKLGKPWKPRTGEPVGGVPRAWDGSTIIHVERDLPEHDPDQLRAAMARCKSVCEEAVEHGN